METENTRPYLREVDGVVNIDDDSGALNGRYPVSDQQISEAYYYRFDEWFPPEGWFCTINANYCKPRHRCFHALPSLPSKARSTESGLDVDSGFNHNEAASEVGLSVDDLPDDIMLVIFCEFHPVQLAHIISLVCQRWYRLCQNSCLWQEVRIFGCKSPICREALRNFLHKFGRFIKKLCIHYCNKYCCDGEKLSETELLALFPESMPSVTTLDIGNFSYFSTTVARFMTRCFPRLERLNMEAITQADDDAFSLIAAQGFPRLKELVMKMYTPGGSVIPDMDCLCKARQLRFLNVERISSLEPGVCGQIANAEVAVFLTRLCISGYETPGDEFYVLANCQNLQLLSLSSFNHGTDATLKYVKKLKKLEHLHFGFAENLTELGLKSFFGTDHPEKCSSSFPTKLKYLSLTATVAVTDNVVDIITTNCPALVSLGLGHCQHITDVGVEFVVHRMKYLQFLDISGLHYLNGTSLSAITSSDLTQLKYLNAAVLRIDGSVLHLLNLQKKNLIICYDDRSFLTFELCDGIARFCGRHDSAYAEAVYSSVSRFEGFCCMTSRYISAFD